jgi:hypothetical protein
MADIDLDVVLSGSSSLGSNGIEALAFGTQLSGGSSFGTNGIESLAFGIQLSGGSSFGTNGTESLAFGTQLSGGSSFGTNGVSLETSLSGSSSLDPNGIESLAFETSLSGNSSFQAPGKESHAAVVALSGGSYLLPSATVERLTLSGSSSLVAHLSLNSAIRTTFSGYSGLIPVPTVGLGVQSPIRYQPASRVVNVSRLVFDQIDLFKADGQTRASGVTIGSLNLKIFFKGSRIEWPLVSGTNIQDLQVTAGRVYWTEFESGFYTLRFFPNVIGAWRVLLTYPEYDQAVSLSYDVSMPTFVQVSSGIHASFIKR